MFPVARECDQRVNFSLASSPTVWCRKSEEGAVFDGFVFGVWSEFEIMCASSLDIADCQTPYLLPYLGWKPGKVVKSFSHDK